MSYNTVAFMASDGNLHDRLVACAAQEPNCPDDPEAWVSLNRWRIVASPEMEAAYDSALAAGMQSPGREENVITDAMILARIQPLINPPV